MNAIPKGKQSFAFQQPPSITAWASVAGKKEAEGPLSTTFDLTEKDTYFGENSWEDAEMKMQKTALKTLAEKANINEADFRVVF